MYCASRKHNRKVAVYSGTPRWRSDGFVLACKNGKQVRVAFAPPRIESVTNKGSCDNAAEMRSLARTACLKLVTPLVSSLQSNGMGESLVKASKRDGARLALPPHARTVM
jgi:transposase InsO family protein